MKKLLTFIVLAMATAVLMCSCRSIYVDIEKPPIDGDVEWDPEGEYFTDGRVYTQGKFYSADGYTYEGVWYYIESQRYVIKTESINEHGMPHTSIEQTDLKRIVKVNAATGQVSSPCLDPVCTHSLGSSCPLMQIPDMNMYILMIADDWIIIENYPVNDPVFGTFRRVHGYNIKTGKTVQIYQEGFENNTSTDWGRITVFDGKFYIVKHELDYSGTKFDPEGNKPLSDYEPETKSYLYEYDLDNDKVKQLFEIPVGADVARMTNKRFILKVDDEIYTCDLDGSNMQKSDGMKFFPYHKIGPFAFGGLENGFTVYDLRTNKTTEVKIEEFKFDASKNKTLTASGMYFTLSTTEEEYDKLRNSKIDFLKQHSDLSEDEAYDLYYQELRKTQYGGKAQIWRCDFDGNNVEKLIEIDNAVMRYVGTTDRYAYVILNRSDPDNGYELLPSINGGKCIIDLETGEVRSVPLLELILPENAWLEE